MLRAPPFRWTWDEIANATDVQIAVTLAAVARQNKAMREATEAKQDPRVPKNDAKEDRYQPLSTDHLSEEEYLKQAMPGFLNTARYFCLNPKNPAHKKYLDSMVLKGLIKRRARIAKLKEEGKL